MFEDEDELMNEEREGTLGEQNIRNILRFYHTLVGSGAEVLDAVDAAIAQAERQS
jgi:hypothetical protein